MVISTPASLPLFVVDTFTTSASFTGNPAAVILLEYDDSISDATKQKIAAQLNLTVTAFVSQGWTLSQPLPTLQRTIRWFTPKNELPLCGHATMASTKALLESQLQDHLTPNKTSVEITFHSKTRGKLGAALNQETNRITLNFPSNPTKPLDSNMHSNWLDHLFEALLLPSNKTKAIDTQYSAATKVLLIRLQDNHQDVLASLSPDFDKLLHLPINPSVEIRAICVTCRGPADPAQSAESDATAQPHFYSRFFAPWEGVNEDPVTGVAHTSLTPYWTHLLKKNLERDSALALVLLGRQVSERGGNVYCTLIGDRVNLSGTARTTVTGQINL